MVLIRKMILPLFGEVGNPCECNNISFSLRNIQGTSATMAAMKISSAIFVIKCVFDVVVINLCMSRSRNAQ